MIEIANVAAVLTDIEGTTSSMSFVRELLFPYARRSLPAYVHAHQRQLAGIATDMAAAVGRQRLTAQQLIELALRWMDEDRKSTPLKALQGLIWQAGYESGELQGHVYEDAVRALRRWNHDGLHIHIYSSGSVQAQQLLFSHTAYGDLTPLLSGYFDTVNGPKLQSDSYQSIARRLGLAAGSVVFLSDHAGELAAAAAAGMRTVLVAREPAPEPAGAFARSLDDITLRG